MSGNGTLNTTILTAYNEMCNEISFDVFIMKLYTAWVDFLCRFIYFAKCKNRHIHVVYPWYIANISMLCGVMLYILNSSVLIWPLTLKTKTETRSLRLTYNKPRANMSVQLKVQKLWIFKRNPSEIYAILFFVTIISIEPQKSIRAAK